MNEEFFDARKYGPKKGQVMAKYMAIAELVDGQMKKDLIGLLKSDKIHQAVKVMQKLGCAKEPDCWRVLREMAEDLLVMPENEVEFKPYKYAYEQIFYTQRENVPNDPHWETIDLLWNTDEVLQDLKNRGIDFGESEEDFENEDTK